MCVISVASHQRGGLWCNLLNLAMHFSCYLTGCMMRSCRSRTFVGGLVAKEWKLWFGVHINTPVLSGWGANDGRWGRQTATWVTALLSTEAWLDGPLPIQKNDCLLNCLCFYALVCVLMIYVVNTMCRHIVMQQSACSYSACKMPAVICSVWMRRTKPTWMIPTSYWVSINPSQWN